MLKKLFLFILLFCVSYSALAQTNCKTNSVVSVNSFYDSYRIISFDNYPDTCKAIEVLRLLPAYSAGDGEYEFEDKKLTDIYKKALSYIFSLDKILSYFKLKAGVNQKTKHVQTLVSNHDDFLNRLRSDSTAIHNVQQIKLDSLIHTVFASPQILAPDSTINLQTLKSQLFSSLRAFRRLYNAMNDSIDIVADESIMIAKLEEVKAGVIQKIADSSAATNRDLTNNISNINSYFIKNFANLDDSLKAYIIGGAKQNDGIYTNLSSQISLGLTSLENASSDSFYYKNETYSLTNFKLPSQTEVIDALAIYLARRFKQEVALTLVDQFRKILKNDKLIYDLFPETYKMFETGKIYEMPTFGSAWNYAVSKDFSNLLTNLSKSSYVQNKIGDTILTGHLQDVVKMCNLINKRFSYIDVVSQLYNDRQLKSDFFRKNIETLYIINKEMFDTAHVSRFWVSPEQLYSLKSIQMKMLLSLIKSKYKNNPGVLKWIDWSDDNKLRQVQNSLSSILLQLNNFQSEQRKLAQLTSGVQTVQVSNYWNFLHSIFEAINVANPNAISPYMQRCINVTNYVVETYSLLTEKNYAGAALKITEILPAIKDHNYIDVKRLVTSERVLKKITDKNIADATAMDSRFEYLGRALKDYLFIKTLKHEVDTTVMDFRRLMYDTRIEGYLRRYPNVKNCNKACLSNLLKNDIAAQKRRIDLAVDSLNKHKLINQNKKLLENNIDNAVAAVIKDYDTEYVRSYINSRSSTQFDDFRKLTGFLSDMMMAGNSRNLSQVIEKYALPPNSYKIKRASRWSWDINAYVGTYIGREIEKPYNNISKGGWVWGLSAPIGISYSWGTTSKKDKQEKNYFSSQRHLKPLTGNSWTFTLSLVDIGAVVSYRLNNSSEGLPQKVQWAQLLSPGGHIRYGIRNTPICISMGLQHSPQLRKLKEDAPLQNMMRTYVGAFFDLPLFNIRHD